MPDLRGATDEEIAEALPGVDEGTDLAGVPSEDSSGSDNDSVDSGSDNNDDGGGDSSTVVTVTGDPGSTEGQTVVGRGDTVRESEIDAATNEDFDADEGTDIDDFEESFGTDQPSSNPDDSASSSTSVVVTDNQQGEQVVVGQGQTTQGARTQAAANPRFDAAQGEEVDAFEEQLDRGQGDGTQPEALQQQRQNNTNSNRRTDPGFFEKAQRLSNREQRQRQEQRQTNREVFQEAATSRVPVVNQLRNVGETAFRESQDIIRGDNPRQSFRDIERSSVLQGQAIVAQGQRFGEDVATSARKTDAELSFTGQPVENTGRAADILGFDEAGQTLQDTGEKIDREILKGFSTLGTQAVGIGTAVPGAGSRALRGTIQERTDSESFRGDDPPTLTTGAVSGFTQTGSQIQDDPIEFFASEGGEEAFETALGFATLGPAGAAIGAAPTPTLDITTTVKNKATNTADFVRTNVADPNAIGSGAGAFVPPESKTGPSSDPRPGQGNTVKVQDLDTTGLDLETEVTNTETAQAQTASNDATGFDLELDSPSATTPTTDAASQPRDTPADDILTEPEGITESRPETVTEGKPEIITESKPETKVESRPDFIVESPPKVEPEIIQEVRPETKAETKPDPTPSFDLGDEEDEDDEDSLLFSSEGQDTQFRSSVGAELIGFTAEEKPDRATVSDPTNLRPVLEN